MPNELNVSPVNAVHAVSDTAGQPRVATGEPAVQIKQDPSALPTANPSLQLDPALGLVVIEFRNNAGEVTTSIPTEQQILAYKRWQATQFGPAPRGMPVALPIGGADTAAPNTPTRVRVATTTAEDVPTANPAPVKRG